jgi:thiol-disulfide isomerase/thioredoxin
VLPTLKSDEMKQSVHQALAHTYVASLLGAGPPVAAVETALLATPFGTELARACYLLAQRDLRRDLVKACLARVRLRGGIEPADLARLEGTSLALEGRLDQALAPLGKAAMVFDLQRDPLLHLRFAQAQAAARRTAEACATATRLFSEHPLLPGVEASLAACATAERSVDTLVAALRRDRQQKVLAGRRQAEVMPPTLSLDDDRLHPVELAPAASGQITVLVFFSTWCPHCATELPRVNSFARAVAARPTWRDRVRIIGVRTAVERDRIPYETYLAALEPVFPILTDSTWSLSFSQFARATGLPAELPTLTVLDERGVLRYVLEPGDYRDTGRELSWAVEDLLGRP